MSIGLHFEPSSAAPLRIPKWRSTVQSEQPQPHMLITSTARILPLSLTDVARVNRNANSTSSCITRFKDRLLNPSNTALKVGSVCHSSSGTKKKPYAYASTHLFQIAPRTPSDWPVGGGGQAARGNNTDHLSAAFATARVYAHPQSMAYSTTPRLQTSTGFPSYSWRLIISGAM